MYSIPCRWAKGAREKERKRAYIYIYTHPRITRERDISGRIVRLARSLARKYTRSRSSRYIGTEYDNDDVERVKAKTALRHAHICRRIYAARPYICVLKGIPEYILHMLYCRLISPTIYIFILGSALYFLSLAMCFCGRDFSVSFCPFEVKLHGSIYNVIWYSFLHYSRLKLSKVFFSAVHWTA